MRRPKSRQSVRINQAWFKSHNSGDVEGIVGLYADDAVVSAPGAAAMRGTTPIRELFTKEIKDFAAAGLTEAAGPNPELAVSGDLAYEWNTYTVTDKSGKTVDTGKYTTIYARRNGKWMIVRDTWNSDVPPPPAT